MGFGVGSRAGSGYESGSIIHGNGPEDPDSYKKETHPKHWMKYNNQIITKNIFGCFWSKRIKKKNKLCESTSS